MSKLLEGRLALILGIANKWSLAYSIAQAFSREGATLALTYLGERQRAAIEDLAQDLNVAALALVNDTLLLSANLRDFARIPKLRVADWVYE